MGKELLPEFIRNYFEIHEWRHAIAILAVDFPKEFADITDVPPKTAGAEQRNCLRVMMANLPSDSYRDG